MLQCSMRILAAADLHGRLPDVEPCDLLLLAGDILPDEDQERFALGPLREWMRSLPADNIVWIAGNHDFYFETPSWQRLLPHFPGTYLQDSEVQIGSLRIWGTPWVENLPEWAFHVDRANASERFGRIPEGIDILLSHSPPGGVLDRVGRESVGSAALASAINRTAPRWSVFGHIHECGGERVKVGATSFYNASLAAKNLENSRPPLPLIP